MQPLFCRLGILSIVIEMDSALREAIFEVDHDSFVRDTVKSASASSGACLYLALANPVG